MLSGKEQLSQLVGAGAHRVAEEFLRTVIEANVVVVFVIARRRFVDPCDVRGVETLCWIVRNVHFPPQKGSRSNTGNKSILDGTYSPTRGVRIGGTSHDRPHSTIWTLSP